MSRPRIRTGPGPLVFAAIAAAFVLAGYVFIWRQPVSDVYLPIRGDSDAYVAMANGEWHTAPPPFRYRILVPWLASLLPMPPRGALAAITYASLFLSYWILLATCRALRIGLGAAVGGVFLAFVSPWHLYNYRFPFLTDGFGLLALSVMTHSLVAGRFARFTAASVLGVLARESTLPMAFAWWPRNRGQAALVSALAAAALIAPRILLGSEGDSSRLAEAFRTVGAARLADPVGYVASLYLTWGSSWLLLATGVWLLPREVRVRIAVALVLLLAGALASSLLATDLGRMLGVVTPLVVLSAAACVDGLVRGRAAPWLAALGVWAVAQACLAWPNRLLSEAQWAALGEARWIAVGAGTICAAAVAIRLWRSVREGFLETARRG